MATAWSFWLLVSAGCLALHAFSRQVPRVPPRALELARWLTLGVTFGPSAGVYTALLLPIWLLASQPRQRLFLEVLGLPALLLAGPQLVPAVVLALATALQLLWLLARLASPPLGLLAPFEERPRLRTGARLATGCLVLGSPLWLAAQSLGLTSVSAWEYATMIWLFAVAASPWRPRGPQVPLPARPRPDLRRWLAAGTLLAGLGVGWLLATPPADSPLAQVLRPLGACVAGDVVILPPGVEVEEIRRLSPQPLRIYTSGTLPRQATVWPWLVGSAALPGLGWWSRKLRAPKLCVAPTEGLTIELGRDLASALSGPLPDEVKEVRQWLAREVGLTLPAVACRLNAALPAHGYRILVRAREAAAGEARAGEVLAVTPVTSHVLEQLQGVAAFGLPGGIRCGVWTLKPDRARELGVRLVRPEELVASHLREILQRQAYQLLSLEEAEELLERHKALNPTLVALAREALPLVELTNLLREVLQRRGSLHDLNWVLQSVVDRAPRRLVDVVAAGCPGTR